MRTSTALWKSIGLLAYLLISSTQQAQAATVTEGITSFDFDQDVDTLSMTTGTGTENEPPRVTLKPHLPPGHEQGRIKNLHPVDKGHHYYTPEGAILGESGRSWYQIYVLVQGLDADVNSFLTSQTRKSLHSLLVPTSHTNVPPSSSLIPR